MDVYRHVTMCENQRDMFDLTNSGRLLRFDDGGDRYTGQPRMGNIAVSVRAAHPLWTRKNPSLSSQSVDGLSGSALRACFARAM